MKKRIQLTENEIISAIREAFEDNQDWRTDMLKGKRKMRQWARPHSMGTDEFRSPEARERYQNLANKRWKEAFDLTRNSQNKFNKDVKPSYRDDWEFEPATGKYKGTFRATLPCTNIGAKDWKNNKMIPYDFYRDVNAIENFVGETCYFDNELDKWIDKNDPSYDKEKALRFWQSQGFGESIVRKVTEGVIRKLNEMKESGFDFLTQGSERIKVDNVSEIDEILKKIPHDRRLEDGLKEKLQNGDVIVPVAYSDYGGTIVDKAIIEYFKENLPDNIVATTSSYNGQTAFIFGKEDFLDNEILEGIYDYEYIQNLEDDLVQERIKEIERDYKIQLDDETWQELREFLHEFHCEPNFVDCPGSEIEEFLSKKGLLPEKEVKPNESIVRKIAENVIRKLNEDNEEVGKRDDRAGIFIAEILKGYDGLLESWGMPKIKFIPFGVYLSGVNGKTFQGDIKDILNPDTNMFEVSFIQDGKVVDVINSYGASLIKKMTQKINGGNTNESAVRRIAENVIRKLNEEREFDGDSVENFDFNKIAIDLAYDVERQAEDIEPDDNSSYTIEHDWSFADGSYIYATIDASYDCVITDYSRGDYYQPPAASGYTTIEFQSEPEVTIWDANEKQWPKEKVAELNIDWSPLNKLDETEW